VKEEEKEEKKFNVGDRVACWVSVRNLKPNYSSEKRCYVVQIDKYLPQKKT